MSKLTRILKDSKVIILIIVILVAIFSIYPRPWAKGVIVRSVSRNATQDFSGLEFGKEKIIEINSQPVHDVDDYYSILSSVAPNRSVIIKTDRTQYEAISGENPDDIGLSVSDVPKTNIQLGLDLQGGTRVILEPEKEVSSDELDTLIESMKQRLNVYGLRDMVIRSARDISGKQFVIVEIAGANEAEVRELLAKQGKFEAKIGNKTVFRGGDDITYVCMNDASCSGIDPRTGCVQAQEGIMCRFMFTISLSPKSAQRQAEVTKDLEVVTSDQGQYLNETLDLYLDDEFVDRLNIAADLKGKATTEVAVSGSGVGVSRAAAVEDALDSMKKLQTILVTGSLPVKLDIVSVDSISPTLGHEFAQNAFVMGLVSILIVAAIVLFRYRKWAITVPILIITWLEIFLLFGAAALFGGMLSWQIDVPSIAGIIISIGTGVNDQIVITDETLRGELAEKVYSWKKKLKKAFFIVFGAYFTTIASMFPLLFAGAGMLRGFAITSIIGLTIGVFITRPAFANIIQILLREG